MLEAQPRPRRSPFGVIAVTGIALLLIALAMIGAGQVAPTGSPRAAPLTPQPRGIQGGTYTLAYFDRLWVQRLGMDAWNRAETDKDIRSQGQIADAFENFIVDAGTQVRVVVLDKRVRQLEILSGKHAGRRGWTSAYSDLQYMP